MKKEKEKNILVVTDGIDAVSNILSCVNPVFSVIPLITFGIARIIGYVSDQNIIKRINKLEEQLKGKKISLEDFKNKINQLTEHNEYIVRNNLNNILLNCIPETVDIYISILIDLIMNQEHSIYEELCEIVSQLNQSDIKLLKMIQEYKQTGVRKYFKLNEQNEKQQIEYNRKIDQENLEIKKHNETSKIKKIGLSKWVDRSVKVGENTIFWKDFAETYNLSIPEMGLALLHEGTNEDNGACTNWAYLVKSFLKLEKLGIIQMDYINTPGTISSLNVERFHITLFGEKLLEYV